MSVDADVLDQLTPLKQLFQQRCCAQQHQQGSGSSNSTWTVDLGETEIRNPYKSWSITKPHDCQYFAEMTSQGFTLSFNFNAISLWNL
jgi:hypothetical protein